MGYGFVAAARLLRRLRPRARRPSLLYERYALANTAGALASTALGVPFFLEVNSPLALERDRYEGGLALRRPLARLERAIFRAADRCLAVSTPLARHLSAAGVPEERVVVLPNGADPDRFDPADPGAEVRARQGCEGRLVVGFVGVVRPWHGLELLARA